MKIGTTRKITFKTSAGSFYDPRKLNEIQSVRPAPQSSPEKTLAFDFWFHFMVHRTPATSKPYGATE